MKIARTFMEQEILSAIDDSLAAVTQLKSPHALKFIAETATCIAECFRAGGKVLIAGNGGSLCDATHFAEELTGLFRKFRPPLPVIAISDPGHLTCVSNDLGFEEVFSRGVEAYGKKNDVFIGLTTSGNSPNIIKAIESAQKLELTTIALLGKSGGKLKNVADFELIITDMHTSDRIQEAHMTALHIIIEHIEKQLFPEYVYATSSPYQVSYAQKTH